MAALRLPTPEVLAVVEGTLRRLGWVRQDLLDAMAERFGGKPDSYDRRLRRAQARGTIDLDLADVLLEALDRTLNDVPSYHDLPLGAAA